ncbi:hypothetical protein, partial [Streptomyces sp. NPDC002403]
MPAQVSHPHPQPGTPLTAERQAESLDGDASGRKDAPDLEYLQAAEAGGQVGEVHTEVVVHFCQLADGAGDILDGREVGEAVPAQVVDPHPHPAAVLIAEQQLESLYGDSVGPEDVPDLELLQAAVVGGQVGEVHTDPFLLPGQLADGAGEVFDGREVGGAVPAQVLLPHRW